MPRSRKPPPVADEAVPVSDPENEDQSTANALISGATNALISAANAQSLNIALLNGESIEVEIDIEETGTVLKKEIIAPWIETCSCKLQLILGSMDSTMAPVVREGLKVKR